jgi:hypothetical protein
VINIPPVRAFIGESATEYEVLVSDQAIEDLMSETLVELTAVWGSFRGSQREKSSLLALRGTGFYLEIEA